MATMVDLVVIVESGVTRAVSSMNRSRRSMLSRIWIYCEFSKNISKKLADFHALLMVFYSNDVSIQDH